MVGWIENAQAMSIRFGEKLHYDPMVELVNLNILLGCLLPGICSKLLV